jgi:hypothetical protein
VTPASFRIYWFEPLQAEGETAMRLDPRCRPTSSRWTYACALTAILLAAPWGCAELDEEEIESTALALSAGTPADRAELALRWAPVHYQDVDQTGAHALGGRADYITRVNFDNNYIGNDNWDHAGSSSYPLAAYVYFSVVETDTHWFIVYMFFHPRDWSDSWLDAEHENDSEGVLLTVARDGSVYGDLKSAVTVAHRDFFSYLPATTDWEEGGEDVDGILSMENWSGRPHPVTAQEAKGHGLKARPYFDINGDGVSYYPSSSLAEVPSGPNDRGVRYKLIDIFAPGGLWSLRGNSSLFASFGTFSGNSSGGCGAGPTACDNNAANPPWGWDDHNDVPGRGDMAADPAGLVTEYFTIPEEVSFDYTFNPFDI